MGDDGDELWNDGVEVRTLSSSRHIFSGISSLLQFLRNTPHVSVKTTLPSSEPCLLISLKTQHFTARRHPHFHNNTSNETDEATS